MLIQASKIIALPIATVEGKQKIGVVKNIIIDKKDAHVLGFMVHVGGILFGRKLFLSETDMLDIDSNGIVVRTNEVLIEPSEILRVKTILKNKFSIFGLKAITKSKILLGKTVNYSVDTNLLQIVSFDIRGVLKNRIIDYKNVYKITNKEIIFKNDITQIPLIDQAKEIATCE